jgi:aminoglycoside phosphotransferase (APT) family kinase protein
MMPSVGIPLTIAEITPSWLTRALRAGGYLTQANIIAIAVRAIGQEVGFLDRLARLHLTYDLNEGMAPSSVVVKVPSREAAYRQIGDRYHAYEREIRFYDDVAPSSPIRLPRCFYRGMDHDADAYLLVLEDLGALTAGDQVEGLTQAQAQAAVETIGRLHAGWWETPALGALDWMPRRNIQPARYRQFWPRFRQALGPLLPAPALTLGEKVGDHLEALLLAMEEHPHTIVHSDFRADNFLFDAPSRPDPVVVVDWRLAIRGRGALDVARLLCRSMSSEDRAACEMAVLRQWHRTLEAGGVKGHSFQQALHDYKLGALLCLYFPVTIHEAEEGAGKRGVGLANAQIKRFFIAALQLWAASVLPT